MCVCVCATHVRIVGVRCVIWQRVRCWCTNCRPQRFRAVFTSESVWRADCECVQKRRVAILPHSPSLLRPSHDGIARHLSISRVKGPYRPFVGVVIDVVIDVLIHVVIDVPFVGVVIDVVIDVLIHVVIHVLIDVVIDVTFVGVVIDVRAA